MRSLLAVLLLSTSSILFACGSPTAPPAEGPILIGRAHVMPKKDPSFTAGAPAMVAHLNYYGGHVLAHVKVVAVMWGSSVSSSTQSQIGGFFSGVTDRAYLHR